MILFSFFCKDLSIAIIKRDKSYKSARLFFWRERERERAAVEEDIEIGHSKDRGFEAPTPMRVSVFPKP